VNWITRKPSGAVKSASSLQPDRIKALGAIDVRDRDDDDLELHVDCSCHGSFLDASAWRSGHHRDQRLAFLDDIGGKLGGVAAADVLGAWMFRPNEQDVAGLGVTGRLPST